MRCATIGRDVRLQTVRYAELKMIDRPLQPHVLHDHAGTRSYSFEEHVLFVFEVSTRRVRSLAVILATSTEVDRKVV